MKMCQIEVRVKEEFGEEEYYEICNLWIFLFKKFLNK